MAGGPLIRRAGQCCSSTRGRVMAALSSRHRARAGEPAHLLARTRLVPRRAPDQGATGVPPAGSEKTWVYAGCASPTGQAITYVRPVPQHEYVCHGALALLARLDVDTGKVLASAPATPGSAVHGPNGQVMSRPEYSNAPRCSSSRTRLRPPRPAAIDRLAKAHPNAIMIHRGTRVLADQIFFSLIRKRSSHRTTSPGSGLDSCPVLCWPSLTATTRPPGRSTGSPPPAS